MYTVRSTTSKIIIKYDKNIVSNEEDKSTLKVIPQQFRKLHVKIPITKYLAHVKKKFNDWNDLLNLFRGSIKRKVPNFK